MKNKAKKALDKLFDESYDNQSHVIEAIDFWHDNQQFIKDWELSFEDIEGYLIDEREDAHNKLYGE